MRLFPILLAGSLAVAAWPLLAANLATDPAPEIKRDTGAPQAVGAAHTLRTIPEACARLEGRFTGNAGKPYDFAAVRTSDRCAPRAKLVDAVTPRSPVVKKI